MEGVGGSNGNVAGSPPTRWFAGRKMKITVGPSSLSTKRARKDLSLFFAEGWLRGEGGCGSWVHRHTLKSTPPQDVQRSMVWLLLLVFLSSSTTSPFGDRGETESDDRPDPFLFLLFPFSGGALLERPPFLLPPSLFSSFRVSLRPLRCSRSYVHTHRRSTADRKERASFSPPSYSGPASPLLPTLLGLSFTKQRRRAMVWGEGGGRESERRG